MKKLFGLFLVIVAAGFYLQMMKYADVIQAACTRVEDISRDAQKMKYVKDWVTTRSGNKEFVDAAIEYKWFDRASPMTPRYIDLDWRYLGFDPQSAWVAFNIDDAEARPAGAATINSISLNQGRHGIIVKLDTASDLVIELGPPGNLSTIRPVSADVFVYCDP